MALLLGAGLAEPLKAMSTYVSSRAKLPTAVLGVLIGGAAVVVLQLAFSLFTHRPVDLTVYGIEFGIVLLMVAQRFGS